MGLPEETAAVSVLRDDLDPHRSGAQVGQSPGVAFHVPEADQARRVREVSVEEREVSPWGVVGEIARHRIDALWGIARRQLRGRSAIFSVRLKSLSVSVIGKSDAKSRAVSLSPSTAVKVWSAAMILMRIALSLRV